MKHKIIELSIRDLQIEGLRFSVDDIARELKISKKTVYKYFSSKEDLAIAVYESFYDDVNRQIDELSSETEHFFSVAIRLYYRSYCMTREELFNKYALNAGIRQLALKKHESVREKFQSIFVSEERDIITMIIDGTFEKTKGRELSPEIVEKLERLI